MTFHSKARKPLKNVYSDGQRDGITTKPKKYLGRERIKASTSELTNIISGNSS